MTDSSAAVVRAVERPTFCLVVEAALSFPPGKRHQTGPLHFCPRHGSRSLLCYWCSCSSTVEDLVIIDGVRLLLHARKRRLLWGASGIDDVRTIIYATADEADAYMFYRCFFCFLFFSRSPQKYQTTVLGNG